MVMLSAFVFLLLATAEGFVTAQEWPQFGGPRRDFTSDAKGLASSWPNSGPKKLWSRELGDGFSGIAVDGPFLYTMYRTGSPSGEREITLAAAAATGKTVWEHVENAATAANLATDSNSGSRYVSPLYGGFKRIGMGPGPYSTPLVTANGVYAVGIMAKLLCLDKKTGKLLWSRDLYGEFKGTPMTYGYSASPIAWKDTVIVKVGGAGHAFIAFNQKDGKVAWKKQDFQSSQSSPILIEVDGQDQLVALMSDDVVGLNPDTGELLWTHPHPTQMGSDHNISMPLWTDDNTLFIASAYDGGCRALELHVVNGKTVVKELWHTNQMRVHIGNLLRIGDTVYASSGSHGPAPLTAIEAKTGKVLWRERSLNYVTFLYADGKLIVVDGDGDLALATVSPTGLKVLSRAELLGSNSWTAPSLVGTTLYIRDRRTLMALDLR